MDKTFDTQMYDWTKGLLKMLSEKLQNEGAGIGGGRGHTAGRGCGRGRPPTAARGHGRGRGHPPPNATRGGTRGRSRGRGRGPSRRRCGGRGRPQSLLPDQFCAAFGSFVADMPSEE